MNGLLSISACAARAASSLNFHNSNAKALSDISVNNSMFPPLTLTRSIVASSSGWALGSASRPTADFGICCKMGHNGAIISGKRSPRTITHPAGIFTTSSMIMSNSMVERAVRVWQFSGRTADFRQVV